MLHSTAPLVTIETRDRMSTPMDVQHKLTYWKSLPTPSHEEDKAIFTPEPSFKEKRRIGGQFSRRRFLEVSGFALTLSALAGCSSTPVEVALPLLEQPEGLIPGRSLQFASTCLGCSAGCGLLATVRDGRPLKMEGMPENPLSKGGLCAIGQALPMGLYDSHRLKYPLAAGKQSDWETVDEEIGDAIKELRMTGGAVRVVTPTITSPTLQATIDLFLSGFRDAQHIMWDALSSSAILDAHARTHGVRVLPRYHFEKAVVIVSLGADFLGAWISPVEFTADWRKRRTPTSDRPEMSYHVQLEGRFSLTGGKADQRLRISPDSYGAVLSHLYVALAKRANVTVEEIALGTPPVAENILEEIEERLWQTQGQSLVVSDSQDIQVQVLVNGVNQLLRNYGATLDIEQPSRQRQGNDASLGEFLKELDSGKVAALFVLGNDLAHNLPHIESLRQQLQRVPLIVSSADREDSFAALANYVCPDHHPLESWLDAEPVEGLVSLSQPLLQPLRQTRSVLESLARWSGKNASAYDLLYGHWERAIFPRVGGESFQSFWDQSVHDGFVVVPPPEQSAGVFRAEVVQLIASEKDSGYLLELHAKVGLLDSRHAHNPWLQELPDPITKVTWDNYVSISPATAGILDLADGDVARVSVTEGNIAIELPVLVQPGQHDRVLAIPLGYGVRGTDRFAHIGPQWLEARPTVDSGDTVGKNAAPFLDFRSGSARYLRPNVTITNAGRRHSLATTQEHHSLEVPAHVAPYGAEKREPIQETTLSAFARDPLAGAPEVHHDSSMQLWPNDHPRSGHAWGMAIDLNTCTGCSACVIACQAENNVPVVGKDEVLRQREMHWIRIDRYYSGEGDDLDVAHQPMMCQHCGNAPCETVCPVLATVHSQEGLNEQTYNRCVGTRYCANNCPYKVRRFNWFDYPHDDSLQNLILNPDVTVRTRGVMEKCSLCVQRIEEGKIEARRLGEPVADGAIRTACQQSCPAQAIVFGDINDPQSRLATTLANPRRFGVLEEFNFQPVVSYLRLVRNRVDQEAPKPNGDAHA